MTLEQLLIEWLPAQRWFATKSAAIEALELRELATLDDTSEQRVTLHLAQVTAGGRTSAYFLPLSWHRHPDDARDHARIGEVDGWLVHDGPRDPTTNSSLIRLMADGSGGDDLTVGAAGPLDVVSGTPLGAEQSNTSIVYGDVIVKVFRRLTASPNPDLDVTRRLGVLGSTTIAPALGWIEGGGYTLAMAQPFLRGATEGWAMALTSVRDLYDMPDERPGEAGGDFAPESERLGRVTATLHAELREVFGVETPPDAATAMGKQMHERLEAALEAVPQLASVAAGVRHAYDAVMALEDPIELQRVHGDLHLGQVLRTQEGWIVLDFEGEPARPLEERIAPMSPLRDVAGMLRSFDYAARHLLADHERSARLDLRAGEWAARNREAFCAGYAAAGGLDPTRHATLLRAMELDKAVYEVRYEADHRPTWLGIPLGAIERLAA